MSSDSKPSTIAGDGAVDLGRVDPCAAAGLVADVLEGAGALILGADFQPLWCNQACGEVLGLAPELLERDFRQTLDETLRCSVRAPADFVDDVLASYAEARHLEDVEAHLKMADREGFVRYTSRPITSGPHAGGRIEYFADDTARHRREQQSRQGEKMEALGRLAGGVAHDFNNVLTAINGYSQLLAQMLPEGPQKSYVEEIRRAGQRAADISTQLMCISRRQIVHPRLVRPRELLDRIRDQLLGMAGENVGFEIRVTTDVGRVKIDPGLLEQVLANLVINASEATPDGGRIILEVANAEVRSPQLGIPVGHYVTFAVTDTGSGIESDVLPHIFEPFFTTREKGKGAGYSLAVVMSAVRRSNGYVHVESVPGEGAVFCLYLPRADEA